MAPSRSSFDGNWNLLTEIFDMRSTKHGIKIAVNVMQ